MGRIVDLSAHCKPTAFYRRVNEHNKDDHSCGSRGTLIAIRRLLKREVRFYNNGERVIVGGDLNEQELHDSEILKFSHASILINQPVGDKKVLWVDATINPVDVWIYGEPWQNFLKRSKDAIINGIIDPEFAIEENPVKEIRSFYYE